DAAAIARLVERARDRGLADRLTLVTEDFLAVRPAGDVVLFQFSLHQMAAPERALAHARELAADAVVVDHAPGSPRSWDAAGEEKVQAAWDAVQRLPVRRRKTIEAWQRFKDHDELASRLAGQGAASRERIASIRDGRGEIAIPMPYGLALL